MSTRHSKIRNEQTAVSNGGGCLSGILLPPLAILGIGAILMFFSLGSTFLPTTGDIQSLQTNESPNNSPSPILSPIFTPEVQYWAGRIQTWAAAAGLDPNLAATVMQIESCGNPRALSRSGAMGLFQVMPYHFTPSDDPYAPNTNALRGLDYLKRSLDTSDGNARLALAGYNGGIGVIGLAESSWTTQTQKYAAWGSGIYADASNGVSKSPHLQDWLMSNGISLCRQAQEQLGINP